MARTYRYKKRDSLWLALDEIAASEHAQGTAGYRRDVAFAHVDGKGGYLSAPAWYRRIKGAKRMRVDWQRQRHLHLHDKDWDGFSQRPYPRDASYYW